MSRHKWKFDFPQTCRNWLGDVAANLRKRNVWQPMFKNVVSTVIMIIIGVIPAVVDIYGKSTFLGAIASVFGQPGQRFGKSKSSFETLLMQYIPLASVVEFVSFRYVLIC